MVAVGELNVLVLFFITSVINVITTTTFVLLAVRAAFVVDFVVFHVEIPLLGEDLRMMFGVISSFRLLLRTAKPRVNRLYTTLRFLISETTSKISAQTDIKLCINVSVCVIGNYANFTLHPEMRIEIQNKR